MVCTRFGWNWPSKAGEEDFKIRQCNFPISWLSPFEKGRGLSFDITKICFVPSLFWNRTSGSGEAEKCEKFTDRRTTGDKKKLNWDLSSGELTISDYVRECYVIHRWLLLKSVFSVFCFLIIRITEALGFVELKTEV